MRSSICWVITSLACFNYIESKSAQLNSSSNVCTQKQQAELNGKCTSNVNSLLNLTDEHSTILVPLSIAKNVTTLCDKITTCFGEFNCAEAQRNKETYERKCEKMEFANYEMMDCISKLYTAFYRKSHNCIGYVDFLTNNPKARRETFVKEKYCVKLIASAKGCKKRALEYLDSKYERFVDIISNKSHDNNCNSLYDELISKQCEPVKKKLSDETNKSKSLINFSRNISSTDKIMQQWTSKLIRSQPNNTAKTPVCDELRNCMQNSCYFSETQINETVEDCTVMYQEAFKLCFDEVKTREDLNSYECVGDKNTSDYKDDKECMKTIMSDNCGNEILTDFDRKWDNYRMNTNSTSGITNSNEKSAVEE